MSEQYDANALAETFIYEQYKADAILPQFPIWPDQGDANTPRPFITYAQQEYGRDTQPMGAFGIIDFTTFIYRVSAFADDQSSAVLSLIQKRLLSALHGQQLLSYGDGQMLSCRRVGIGRGPDLVQGRIGTHSFSFWEILVQEGPIG